MFSTFITYNFVSLIIPSTISFLFLFFFSVIVHFLLQYHHTHTHKPLFSQLRRFAQFDELSPICNRSHHL